ncbi:MAG TPA: 4Fe-4S dicluster domain-containing protein [Actinobacteria bacterium]|nr:4Fe-4S dicluster domain-containing protein [Actinomycetota bacterium]
MAKAILYDASKCTACRACYVACKQWNVLAAAEVKELGTYYNALTLDGTTWNLIDFIEKDDPDRFRWHFISHRCMHCGDPSCANVCAAGAITKDSETGFVLIDNDKCLGCKNCHYACPFWEGVPRFRDEISEAEEEWMDHGNKVPGKRVASTMYKCRGCVDRVKNGLEPACVTTCPPDALQFGDKGEMLSIANARVALLKERGETKAQVYDPKGVGGTGVIYVLLDDPEVYGLPADPKVSTADMVTKWLTGLITAGILTIVPFWMVFKAAEAEGKGGE